MKNRMIKTVLGMLVAFALVFSAFAPVSAEAATTPSLSKTKKTLYAGKSFTLALHYAKKTVTWSSTNSSVAKVNSVGKVTAVAKGTCYIIAKHDGTPYKCKITVKDPYLNSKDLSLMVGDTFTIKLTGATMKSCKSANTSVAKVTSKGVITAKGEGSTKITVTDSKKRTYTLKLSVTANNTVGGPDTFTVELSDGTIKSVRINAAAITLDNKDVKYVYLGNYPQAEVEGSELTSAIKNANYVNNYATVNGVTYKRVNRTSVTYISPTIDTHYYFDWSGGGYHYFKVEPIKWRVLSYDGSKMLLISEYALDGQFFNTEYFDAPWETSTIRSWLNGYRENMNQPGINYATTGSNFIHSAFTEDEEMLIRKTTLSAASNENPYLRIAGGNEVSDNIFLMSWSELTDNKLGFELDYMDKDELRQCGATKYARAMGTAIDFRQLTDDGVATCEWWTRNPGSSSYYASAVRCDGTGFPKGYEVNTGYLGVRPAMTISVYGIIK